MNEIESLNSIDISNSTIVIIPVIYNEEAIKSISSFLKSVIETTKTINTVYYWIIKDLKELDKVE